ncbi:MAG: 2-C-methyl-D-erythritol 4-phosphate cytidylyltransferase [Eubacterium sp.]|nr:2-C-methyl-D-erythritol 4-phosphate cytidylyltransferase [Eubacterium sp.]
MEDIAIVLAGGRGSRMKSASPKQFMLLGGKEIIYYSLKAFENSKVSKVILVTGEDYIDFCQKEIVDKYGLTKVEKIVAGGAERYDSVYSGLKNAGECGYVYIHDGARPFITTDLINRMYDEVRRCDALIAAVPSKDTIKVADDDGFVKETPERRTLWSVQTPQVFRYDIIMEAYEKMMADEHEGITDDAMVYERYGDGKVKLFTADYSNIKITTPEDMIMGENFLKKFQ